MHEIKAVELSQYIEVLCEVRELKPFDDYISQKTLNFRKQIFIKEKHIKFTEQSIKL